MSPSAGVVAPVGRGRLVSVDTAAVDVLVVEDAPEYADLIATVLRQAGYDVRVAGTGGEAVAAIRAAMPAVTILDLTLPDIDGLDLCRQIRAMSDAYVLMLTARTDEVDKVLGLKMGADDYVTKPFSSRELLARLEALLRRRRGPSTNERRIGDLVLRPAAREVEVAGTLVELTRIEFDLLDALTINPSVVLTRDNLLEQVWGPGWYGDVHVVDVHIANLRRKIDPPNGRSYVRTVRGVGYGIAR